MTKILGMPNPPQLSPEQRLAALEKAAAVRTQRAEIKAGLKKGSVSLVGLLERAPKEDLVGKMKVSAVLENLPLWQGQSTESHGAGRHQRYPQVSGLGCEPEKPTAFFDWEVIYGIEVISIYCACLSGIFHEIGF